jgi:hypothetical protein
LNFTVRPLLTKERVIPAFAFKCTTHVLTNRAVSLLLWSPTGCDFRIRSSYLPWNLQRVARQQRQQRACASDKKRDCLCNPHAEGAAKQQHCGSVEQRPSIMATSRLFGTATHTSLDALHMSLELLTTHHNTLSSLQSIKTTTVS